MSLFCVYYPGQIAKMPQSVQKLHRVIKAISGKGKQIRPKTDEDAKTNWKLSWMIIYDESRKEVAELRKLLDAERAKVQLKSQKNIALQQVIQKAWTKNDEKKETINRLKEKIKAMKNSTLKVDKSIQTTNALSNVHTQTNDFSKISESTQTDVEPSNSTPSPTIKKFKCEECEYATNKSSSFKDHMQVHNRPEKTFECAICKKLFTQRGLHINNYVRGQHKPTGKHASFSIDQHIKYRDSLAE